MVSKPNFEMLENGCSTLNARCSRCFKGEGVTSRDGLVEAVDAAKVKRLRVGGQRFVDMTCLEMPNCV